MAALPGRPPQPTSAPHTGPTVPRESWDSPRKAAPAQVQAEGPFRVKTWRTKRVSTLEALLESLRKTKPPGSFPEARTGC